jgi:hypothetical protein
MGAGWQFMKVKFWGLVILPLLTVGNCYNYLSDDIPIVLEPKISKRIPVVSLSVRTSEGERERERIAAVYTRYLEESGYFGRVLGEGIRAPLHLEIYTAIMDEYENAWTATISTVFCLGTAGLLPAMYGERRILRLKVYKESDLIADRIYTQKHTTLFGLVFLLIWERGIEEKAEIEFNKERNLIHNVIQDLGDL